MLDITVYSLPTRICVKCRATEISLRHKGIEATKVLVDEDREAMEFIKSLGYTEAPVVVIREAGQVVDHWGGYREERLKALQKKVPA